MIKIRRAEPDDGDVLKSIDSSMRTDPNREQFIDTELATGTISIALIRDQIVGYSVVNSSFFRRPTVEMLMVSSSFRRCGVGRELLRHAMMRKGTELWVTTNESNLPMQSLLSDEGFQRVGKIEGLDPGDAELVYVKKWF